MFGFDILLDRNLKAWLIEVNVSPSLSSSSPMDRNIKNTLMSDVFHLAGFTPYDPRKLDEEREAAKQERMMGRTKFTG